MWWSETLRTAGAAPMTGHEREPPQQLVATYNLDPEKFLIVARFEFPQVKRQASPF